MPSDVQNISYSQEHIIPKLKRYFEAHKAEYTQDIEEKAWQQVFEDGICEALTAVFLDKTIGEWESFLRTLCSSSNEPAFFSSSMPQALEKTLQDLMQMIGAVYFSPLIPSTCYLGKKCADYLRDLSSQCALTLLNPWHVVGVKRDLNHPGTWLVYDSNDPWPYKRILHEKLFRWVSQALGEFVMVHATEQTIVNFSLNEMIPDHNQFIRAGGLSLFKIYPEYCEPMSIQIIDDNSLWTGMLECAYDLPAWAEALMAEDEKVLEFTGSLLNRFVDTYQFSEQALTASLNKAAPEDKQVLHQVIQNLDCLTNEAKNILLISIDRSMDEVKQHGRRDSAGYIEYSKINEILPDGLRAVGALW